MSITEIINEKVEFFIANNKHEKRLYIIKNYNQF